MKTSNNRSLIVDLCQIIVGNSGTCVFNKKGIEELEDQTFIPIIYGVQCRFLV